MSKEVLLQLTDAVKEFSDKRTKTVHAAVNHVDLTLYQGETVGLVGESGSGKTTLGRCLLTLTELTSGSVQYRGRDLAQMSHKERRDTLRNMQIIFQDPYAALNPRMTALQLVMEPLYHLPKAAATQAAIDVLALVGITGEAIHKYPKAFSGGQRQRIGIARAVVGQPEFVLCDEPTSALDVSIQAQILQLLVRLQREFQLTYLFITHDLSVVRYIADRIAVMYRGHLVEVATSEDLFANPQHLYTKKLLAAAPVADPEQARQQLATTDTEGVSFSIATDDAWEEVAPDHWVRRSALASGEKG